MKKPGAAFTYLFLEFTSALLFSTAFTVSSLYEVTIAGLTPLQLVLVGTALEITILLFEIPTGVVADVVSRRASILIGQVLMGVGFLVWGIFPAFLPILLAQVLWGLGYTFTSGATQAWITDEIGEEKANRAFLAANRMGLLGSLAGLLLAILIGSFTTAAVPIVVSGVGRVVLALLLIFVMVERGFKPVRKEARSNWQQMGVTFRQGLQTIRRRPALLAVLGVGLFHGLYSEGFDRLWVKHLLDAFSLPVLFGSNPVAFFGLLDAAAILISMAATRIVEKRVDTGKPKAIGRAMLGITAGLAVSSAAFVLSPLLGVALGFYIVMSTLRNIRPPLADAWVNQRLDPDVRATILSMAGQVDAVGQIAGGPAIGLVANAVSVPVAMLASAGLMLPALPLILRANRLHGGEIGEE